MNESKPLTHSPFAALSGVRYPAHTPRPGMKPSLQPEPVSTVVRRIVRPRGDSPPAPVATQESLFVQVEVADAEKAKAPAGNGAAVMESGQVEGEVREVKKVGKKKRARRVHGAEFIQKVIAAVAEPGMSPGKVGKRFDVSPTLVSRWVMKGAPRGRGQSEPAKSMVPLEMPRVKRGGGVTGLDRVVLLLAESAKYQVLSAGLQQKALDEIAKLNTALSLVFQPK